MCSLLTGQWLSLNSQSRHEHKGGGTSVFTRDSAKRSWCSWNSNTSSVCLRVSRARLMLRLGSEPSAGAEQVEQQQQEKEEEED